MKAQKEGVILEERRERYLDVLSRS